MIQELETIVLTRPFPKHGLEEGDVGVVVHVYARNAAYEVEFVNAAGKTVALMTVESSDIRPMAAEEILHARAVDVRAA